MQAAPHPSPHCGEHVQSPLSVGRFPAKLLCMRGRLLSGHRVNNKKHDNMALANNLCWAPTDNATQSLIPACCGNMADISWCCTYLTVSLPAQLIYTAIGWRCMFGEELQVCVQGCAPRLSQQLHISVLSEVGQVRGSLIPHSLDLGRVLVDQGDSSLQDCTGTLRKGNLSRLYPANIQDISHPGPHDILSASPGSMHIS